MPKFATPRRTFTAGKSKIPRPLNSFMIFRLEHQASVGLENPDATHQEISKLLSVRWKELDTTEKQKYIDRANYARDEHKLLYPNYKYCPRKRDGPPKGISRAPRAIKPRKNEIMDYQFEQGLGCFRFMHEFADNTTVSSQPMVPDSDFNVLNESTIIDSPIYDNTLLCPMMHVPCLRESSTSPCSFTVSHFSGFSTSPSSEYEPTMMQVPPFYDNLAVHPYDCRPLFDGFMPAQYEYIPTQYEFMPTHNKIMPDFGFHQVEPGFYFPLFDETIPEDHEPSHQITFPEACLPATLLSHTPFMEEIINEIDQRLSIFDSNEFIPNAPLLTQPFFYMDM